MLERALVRNPTVMQPWVNLGNVEKQLRDGVLEEARGANALVWRLYRTARRLAPDHVDVTANIAGLLAVERQWEEAAAARRAQADVAAPVRRRRGRRQQQQQQQLQLEQGPRRQGPEEV